MAGKKAEAARGKRSRRRQALPLEHHHISDIKTVVSALYWDDVILQALVQRVQQVLFRTACVLCDRGSRICDHSGHFIT
jgi:hypothetical protein